MRVGTSQTMTSCAALNLWTISHVVYVSIPFLVLSGVTNFAKHKDSQCRLHGNELCRMKFGRHQGPDFVDWLH